MIARVIVRHPGSVYRIRAADGSWQATVLLDDEVGEITIHSEWGHFWFAWYPSGRGTKSLREFLTGCDSSYLCGKFLSAYRDAGLSRTHLDRLDGRLMRFLANDWPSLVAHWESELSAERALGTPSAEADPRQVDWVRDCVTDPVERDS